MKPKTADSAAEYGVLQVSYRSEPFRFKIRTVLNWPTAELECLAVELYGRRLSTRDIEATFRD